MALTKNDIKGLLTEQKQDLVHEMDKRFERNILQILFDQQLRKTNGLIKAVARQLQQTHTVITHALDKQDDLEARVEKLEQQTPVAL